MDAVDRPDLTRYADWLDWLRRLAEDDPDVLVVWVGGSAATGGYDDWSDLDVEILCTTAAQESTFARVMVLAAERFDIDHVWHAPHEWWPDGRQAFINLQHRPGLLAEPTRLVDLRVTSYAEEHARVDVRRHGTPIVVHDPDGLIALRHDEVAMESVREQAIDQIRQRRGTGQWLVNRAIVRGDVAEAVSLHLRFALEPLVRVLRHQHCPWRHDYGLRYLRTDLPPEVAARVEALVPGHGGLGLRAQSDACFAWLDELLD